MEGFLLVIYSDKTPEAGSAGNDDGFHRGRSNRPRSRKRGSGMPKFIPGLELSRLFYQKEVRPILASNFSRLAYSAALFGWGSEVLGYDTQISRDHHWGPRVFIFLSEQDYGKLVAKIHDALCQHLPYSFMGYSTNFSEPEPNGVRHPIKINSGTVNHMIHVYTVKSFFEMRLKFNPHRDIQPLDWLTFPQHRLLELVSGNVFYDGLKSLEKIRRKFAYYPKDVWLYMLASQWQKISQEEAFVGRTGDTGDELGSQVIAARIVRELMKLCFLMERRYHPYLKWFGTGFSKLAISRMLSPLFRRILLSDSWKERESWLAKAYEAIARKHNSLKLTKPLPTKVVEYYGRPYLVIHADSFAAELMKGIKHKSLKNLAPIGSLDQFIDSTDVSENLLLREKLRTVYES
jgi:hypothetical protein